MAEQAESVTTEGLLPYPLDPMPAAPPEVVATWVDRIGKGALLAALLVPVGYFVTLPRLFAIIPPWASAGISAPVVDGLAFVGLWLLTTPPPQDRRWCMGLRWAARIGYLVRLIVLAIAIARLAGPRSDWRVTGYLSVVYIACAYAQSVAQVAALWYLSRLAYRLKDRRLRLHFDVLKWLCLIPVILVSFWALTRWESLLEMLLPRPDRAWSWSPGGVRWDTICFLTVLTLTFGAYWFYLQWRLRRRAREAAQALRAMDLSQTT